MFLYEQNPKPGTGGRWIVCLCSLWYKALQPGKSAIFAVYWDHITGFLGIEVSLYFLNTHNFQIVMTKKEAKLLYSCYLQSTCLESISEQILCRRSETVWPLCRFNSFAWLPAPRSTLTQSNDVLTICSLCLSLHLPLFLASLTPPTLLCQRLCHADVTKADWNKFKMQYLVKMTALM